MDPGQVPVHSMTLPEIPRITVLIPTKNEAATIGSIVKGVRDHCDEVLVVDARSTDGTAREAEAAGARVIFDDGKGKGAGLRMGLREASGDIVVCMDADGSHEMADIPKLVDPVRRGDADMVVGCRMTGGSDELHGDIGKFARFMGSMIITLVINYRWNVRLTDVQNGFRAVRREIVPSLALASNDFTIEEEMVMKCLRKEYRVMNVATHEYARRVGRSRIVLRKVWFGFGWVVIKNVLGLAPITHGAGETG